MIENINKPKTIKIFLADGSPTGIKIAEIDNRTIKGIIIPRNRLESVKDRTEVRQPSVYFLIGQSEDTGEVKVYIGEAENLYKRLITHTKKEFWHTVLAFISKDQNLTKAHVKFLESNCIEVLKKVDRCQIENATESSETMLPESDVAGMLEFIEDLKLLASALGFSIFADISEDKIKSEDVYFCKGKRVEAKGSLIDEGFVVYKGSRATVKEAKTIGNRLSGVRKDLINDNILVQETGKHYLFEKDYVFGSPSTAAGVILGCPVNGWLYWKNNKGKTLDETIRK
jgi:hypothetical protein